MNKNIFKKPSVILLAAAALLMAVGTVLATVLGHGVFVTVVMILGSAGAIGGFCLVLSRLVEKDSRKPYHRVFFCAVVYLLTLIAALVAGKQGSLSFGIIHTLCDGMLCALGAALALAAIDREKMTVAVVAVGVVGALLTFFDLATVGHIYMALLGLLLVAAALKGDKRRETLVLGGLMTLLSVLVLIMSGSEVLHRLIHISAELALICVGLLTAKELAEEDEDKTLKVKAEKNQKAKEPEKTAVTQPESKLVPQEEQTDSSEKVDRVLKKIEAERVQKWLDKAYRDKPYSEVVDAPVDALYGLSEGDAKLLKEAFGIDTVRELAENRFFNWALEIVNEAESEKK